MEQTALCRWLPTWSREACDIPAMPYLQHKQTPFVVLSVYHITCRLEHEHTITALELIIDLEGYRS